MILVALKLELGVKIVCLLESFYTGESDAMFLRVSSEIMKGSSQSQTLFSNLARKFKYSWNISRNIFIFLTGSPPVSPSPYRRQEPVLLVN